VKALTDRISGIPRHLSKPHYIFRPTQLLRRVRLKMTSEREADVLLPWGLPMRVRTDETIGSAIARTGVYDLCATEVLFRLTDPGEVAIDAGANIGYMTSALAAAVGLKGRVEAFEPHPELFSELVDNVTCWRGAPIGEIRVHQLALSRRSGVGMLHVSDEFKTNRGTATLDSQRQETSIDVPLARLDALVAERIGVMKLDVEGHEVQVLGGSDALLAGQRIRDIVFEEHNDFPTELTKLLESHGFVVFAVDEELLGPRIHSLPSTGTSWDPPTYLATLDPTRALRRLRRRGWSCLGKRAVIRGTQT
jgi:FkbM family methyltransferase